MLEMTMDAIKHAKKLAELQRRHDHCHAECKRLSALHSSYRNAAAALVGDGSMLTDERLLDEMRNVVAGTHTHAFVMRKDRPRCRHESDCDGAGVDDGLCLAHSPGPGVSPESIARIFGASQDPAIESRAHAALTIRLQGESLARVRAAAGFGPNAGMGDVVAKIEMIVAGETP